MPHQARNHQESRKKVCLLCMRKSNEVISPSLQQKIIQKTSETFDFNDPRVPLGICSSCRLSFSSRLKSSLTEQSNLVLIDFNSISVPRFHRSSPISCNCLICKVARTNSKNGKGSAHPLQIKKRKPGRPSATATPETHQKSSTSFTKQCTKCLTEIKQGKPHNCSPKTLTKNFQKLAEKYPKAAEQIASSIIKKKKASPAGTIRLSQEAGPLYPLACGSVASIHSKASIRVSTDSLITIQQTTKLSNNKMRQLATVINKTTPTGSGVEPYFQSKFSSAGKELVGFFQSKKELFETRNGSKQRDVIFCSDLEGMMTLIAKQRSSSMFELFVKVCLDNGGNFFKVCLQLVDQEEIGRYPQQSSMFNHKKKLSTGINKLLIIAIAEDIKENYSNLSIILNLLELDKIKFVVASDLKIANLLCGIQSHASKHPCCYCEISSECLIQCGQLRTFGSLHRDFTAFSSSTKAKAMEFNNSIHQPLLQEHEDVKVLNVIPPPELHLLLGIVNHLFVKMKNIWPEVNQWPEMIHVKPAPYQGGEQFNGPACHKLLQHIDALELLAQKNLAFHVQPWIDALRSFKKVVHACFGMELQPDFQNAIREFQNHCQNLHISITPKLHILFHHVPQFIASHNEALGLYTEQTGESAHHDFKLFWEHRFKRHLGQPSYSSQLLNAVIEYNSKHI